MKFILTTTLLLLSLPAAAAEKPLKIAENHTDFSVRFIDSIARTSMALGVKEPLIIRSETGAAVVGGSSKVVCRLKLLDDREKIGGIACK